MRERSRRAEAAAARSVAPAPGRLLRWLLLVVTVSPGAAPMVPAPAAMAGPTAQRPLVIGSKAFTESRILAHMLAQLVEARSSIPVTLRDGLGGTLIAHRALLAGEIDIYPEYTGTAWSVVLHEGGQARDPLRTFLTVARAYERRFHVRWLLPFGFSNSYALAVSTSLAERLGLQTISDLLPVADQLRVGVSHEFLERADGWPGLSAAYGLSVADLRGLEHGLAPAAIRTGAVDVIDAYTTDGKLLREELTVLADDRGFWPPYQCAPVVREDALVRFPDLADLLERLAFRLPAQRMAALNGRVELDGLSFGDAAREFLTDEGLLTNKPSSGPAVVAGDLWSFLRGRLRPTLRLLLEHLGLTLGAVLAAVALAVPLGVALSRRPRAAGLALGVAGVLQTVPSLALLAIMLPILGLGVASAMTALFLYALLPILRNTITGIVGVDAELVDAARGMGLSRRQRLWRIELPLAMPTIMAGIRTASVITVGVATLAAFVGAGGLGEPIVTGLQLDDMRLVLAGALPAASLALVVDRALGGLERRLTRHRARPAGARETILG